MNLNVKGKTIKFLKDNMEIIYMTLHLAMTFRYNTKSMIHERKL